MVDVGGKRAGAGAGVIRSADQVNRWVPFIRGCECLSPRLAAAIGHGRSTERRGRSDVQDCTSISLEIGVVWAVTADEDIRLVAHLKTLGQPSEVLHDVTGFYCGGIGDVNFQSLCDRHSGAGD